jgi:hypothetical protein
MEVSQYFERTLFYDRSPAADEYYERSASLIFENDISGCRIEVRYQSCRATLEHATVHPEDDWTTKRDKKSSEGNRTEKSIFDEIISGDGNKVYDSDGSCSSRASSTELPDALDQRRGEHNPPLYPRPNTISGFSMFARDIRIVDYRLQRKYSRSSSDHATHFPDLMNT